MNKVLVDTDIFSEIARKKNPSVVRNAIDYAKAHGRLTISVITVMELVKGLFRIRRTQYVVLLLTTLASEEIIDFDRKASEWAGRILADLDRTGQPIGVADTMIAAVALNRGLDLATGNLKHFRRIQQLGYPINLIDWRN